MSERLTNILGYLTLFAILGAIWVLFGEDPTRDQGGRGEPTFEGVRAVINDVTEVRLVQGDDHVTLEKTDHGWTIAERAGYAADTDRVRDFLRGVALSERREPKTADPDRFTEIGLGSGATHVSLMTSGDEAILSFDMGKQSTIGSDRSLTYIFQEKDTRAWLVTALSESASAPAWWLDRGVLDIAAARVHTVDLSGVRLSRKLGESDFTPEGMGKGEEAVASWRLGEPARILTGLSAEDVRHLGNPLSEPKARVALETHDGLLVSLELYDMDGATWAQITAHFDAAKRNEGDAGLLPDAPEDGAAEAEAINAGTRGWFFKLSDADAETLSGSRGDFITKKQAAANPAS